MALVLVLVGIVLWVTVAPTIGLILVIVGVVLFIAAPRPYGRVW